MITVFFFLQMKPKPSPSKYSVTSSRPALLSTSFQQRVSNTCRFMTNISVPKLPDGEKVDFDVSKVSFRRNPFGSECLTRWISGGRTSTGSVRRRTWLSCSLWSKLTSSRGRRKRRSSSLSLTGSWVSVSETSAGGRALSDPCVCVFVGEASSGERRAAESQSRQREGETGPTGSETSHLPLTHPFMSSSKLIFEL